MSGPLQDVRPEERRGALAGFLTLFGQLAAHTLLETARDALFLARLPAQQLPWVYLGIAALAVAASQGSWKLPRWLTGRFGLSAFLLVSSLVTLGFWWLGAWQDAWVLRGLYVWTGLLSTLAAVRFWLVMGGQYTVTQARRLYKIIGSGALLGAVSGGALARYLAQRGSAEDLVLASALVLGATALGPALLVREQDVSVAPGSAAPRIPTGRVVSLLREQPYLRGLARLVLVSTVALTLGDYVFKSVVAERVAAAELGAFFATVYTVLNALALVVQLLLTGWILRLAGLHRALWVLPVGLFLGAAGVAFGGGILAALVLKGADGSLRSSLHRTTSELLFLPIPDSLRIRAKPLIDVAGHRGGQALASVVILSEIVLERGDAVLAAAAAALCIAWIVLAADLRSHYLDLFRRALRTGALRDSADLEDLDRGSLETLFAALNSRDDSEVLGALDLLSEGGRDRLIPALVLFHPSRSVVLRALELFSQARRTDFVPVADRLASHPEPEVRAAALRARTTVMPEEAPLRGASQDTDPLVRATALAGLVSGGWVSDEAQATLDRLLQESAPAARLALVRAIRQQPAPVFEPLLLQLADDPDVALQAEVARAMGQSPSEAFLPALLRMLGDRDVRDAARETLIAHGDAALEFLAAALSDTDLPQEIRRHLPRTLSRFPASRALPVLLERYTVEQDGMVAYKILRGLGRLAADHPELALDERPLRQGIERTLSAVFRVLHWRQALLDGARRVPARATPGQRLLVDALRSKERNAVERLFRLLALVFRGEDFRGIYRGLESADVKVGAVSRELIQNVVRPAELRDAVLASVDDGATSERLAAAARYYQTRPLSYEELLGVILEAPSETLRCIVAYHVGELGLETFRERLASHDPRTTDFFVSRVFERVLASLGGPSRLAHAP